MEDPLTGTSLKRENVSGGWTSSLEYSRLRAQKTEDDCLNENAQKHADQGDKDDFSPHTNWKEL